MYVYKVICGELGNFTIECAGIALQEGTGTISFYNKEGVVLAIFPATAMVLLNKIDGEPV